MSRMSELAQVLNEMIACGEGLIKAAMALREMLLAGSEEKVQMTAEETPGTILDAQQKTYTFVEVRKAFSSKAHAGYTEQIKALIGKYGADKLSAVNEKDYARLMADLEAIG